MCDPIERCVLRSAVDVTMQRYPYFCVELRKNDGQYVFEHNTRPVVISDTLEGTQLNSEGSNYHMIAFSAEDDWIVLDVFQPGLGLLHGVCLDPEGQELGLGETVVALGQLVLQHLRVFVTDTVEIIFPVRDPDPGLEALRVSRHIHETELEMDGAVEEVQETAPFLEDGRFVLLLGQLVVDILELDGLGVKASDAADAVGEHPVKGNRLLGGPGDPIIFLCAVDDFLDPALILFGEPGGKLQ